MDRDEAIRYVMDAWSTLDEQYAWRHAEDRSSSPETCFEVLHALGVTVEEFTAALPRKAEG